MHFQHDDTTAVGRSDSEVEAFRQGYLFTEFRHAAELSQYQTTNRVVAFITEITILKI